MREGIEGDGVGGSARGDRRRDPDGAGGVSFDNGTVAERGKGEKWRIARIKGFGVCCNTADGVKMACGGVFRGVRG